MQLLVRGEVPFALGVLICFKALDVMWNSVGLFEVCASGIHWSTSSLQRSADFIERGWERGTEKENDGA